MSSRLRVLYLTHHGPWPVTSGGRLRDAALIPELMRLSDLEVWAVSRRVALDRAALSNAPGCLRIRIFPDESKEAIYPSRDSKPARAELLRVEEKKDFDLVHVEGHYMVHMLPDDMRTRTVVVEHNVESHLLRQMAQHNGWSSGLASAIKRLSRTEEEVWSSLPRILTLSAEDRDRILSRVPSATVAVTSNGADHIPAGAGRTGSTEAGSPVAFGFLANYSYSPNQDALDWLLDDIFPAIRDQVPQASLMLAGGGLESALAGRIPGPGVYSCGWVASPASFFGSLDVALCPLRVGGGVKAKMIETIRAGTPVVATGVALEGLPDASRHAVVRADETADFVSAAVRLTADTVVRNLQLTRMDDAQRALPTWAQAAAGLYRHWLDVGGARER